MVDATVRVDSKRLREFSELLNSTSNDFQRCVEVLDNSLSRLGSSWRDQQFSEFAQEVKQVRRVLEDFAHEAASAQREIVADAQRAEAYEKIQSR